MVLLLDPDPVAAMEIAYEALNALESRIEALEKAQTSVDCERVHRDIAEDERKDRWHATYNAALQGLLATKLGSETYEGDIGASCALFADRAHGPLEADAPREPKWTTLTPIGVCNVFPSVEALMKAAQETAEAWQASDGSDDPRLPHDYVSVGLAVRRLVNALKPFEASR